VLVLCRGDRIEVGFYIAVTRRCVTVALRDGGKPDGAGHSSDGSGQHLFGTRVVAQPQPSQPDRCCASALKRSTKPTAGRCADLRNDTADRCYVAYRGSAAPAALRFRRTGVPARLSGICAPTSLTSRGPGWILVPGARLHALWMARVTDARA
jgi:hypothetical protein